MSFGRAKEENEFIFPTIPRFFQFNNSIIYIRKLTISPPFKHMENINFNPGWKYRVICFYRATSL